MPNLSVGTSKAALVLPSHVLPQPANRQDWRDIGNALLEEARNQYGISKLAQTIAVGWTGIAGLESKRFVGASRTIRAAVALPVPVDHINAPRNNAQFVDHAEQDVANAFIDALNALHHEPALDGQWLRIFVSQRPCSPCVQGLDHRHVPPGVLGQLSRLYPGLTVVLAWEQEDKLHSMILQNGARL
jgi:hypothetical protein